MLAAQTCVDLQRASSSQGVLQLLQVALLLAFSVGFAVRRHSAAGRLTPCRSRPSAGSGSCRCAAVEEVEIHLLRCFLLLQRIPGNLTARQHHRRLRLHHMPSHHSCRPKALNCDAAQAHRLPGCGPDRRSDAPPGPASSSGHAAHQENLSVGDRLGNVVFERLCQSCHHLPLRRRLPLANLALLDLGALARSRRLPRRARGVVLGAVNAVVHELLRLVQHQ
mmetsp:Transcript_68806/g.215026  ORF Transcript_68806/g.215026 Transcript_68806/m.215026 type:complete len:222 (-) Transcript_68806:1507-2172(-)